MTSWVTNRTVRPVRRVPAADELGDLALVAQVEVRQRLVAEQELRVADEGLGDAQALLLAARQAPDRAHPRTAVPRPTRSPSATRRATRPIRPADAPAVAVEPEPDEVAAAQRQVPVEGLVLGHVPDAGLPRRGGCPRTSTEPLLSAVRPSTTRRSEVLPDPFGPRIATKLPSLEGERQVVPDLPAAEGEAWRARSGRPARSPAHEPFARACSSSFIWASCHAWYVVVLRAASSRPRPTTGMPLATARSWICWRERRDDLAVVEQDPHLLPGEQVPLGGDVGGGRVGAVLDRLLEALRRQHLQADRRGEVPGDRLREGDRRARVLRLQLGDLRVSGAREAR